MASVLCGCTPVRVVLIANIYREENGLKKTKFEWVLLHPLLKRGHLFFDYHCVTVCHGQAPAYI